MIKRFSVMALAGLLVFPAVSMAGGSSNVADLERKIEELSRQLNDLKAAMEEQAETNEEQDVALEDLDERSEDWDLAARIKFYGDYRGRLDYYSADRKFGSDVDNDTLWTNRFRLNMRAKATENMEFKARLAMFKAWGNQSGFYDASGAMWPVFDGNVTRTPEDSALYVDRVFVNWNNIGGIPMWFSIGRRPTTDGPPAEMRMGTDERMATPMSFMDWPFDGISVGYAWSWGNETMGDSRIRFCYGRGFEAGLQADNSPQSADNIDDMDFAGLSWDVMKKDDRFLYLQSYVAFNVIRYPDFQNPDDTDYYNSIYGDNDNLGKIWHSAAVYEDKVSNLNYFIAGGLSYAMPDDSGWGMFSDFARMGAGLKGPNYDNETGYSLYAGVRYDIDDIGLKVGGEFNWGSQYWIAMAPGHDEIYMSKLATRGQVYEAYLIYDLPTGDVISKYAKTFMRLGYQHYEYDYAGSGDWNMYPYDLGSSSDMMYMNGLVNAGMANDPVERADQVYLTFEVYF
ncbi:DUF3373 family protein [Desulfopila aestuarii]|uniref:DUF3373 domain-containing protein n=1 Tax=Desulfopila aestuarii DSM 18488 TaxID=1121416 RepID=A0A1M7Y6G8_9BACT|nr:DUF3373 family protein [Desulfopila aestuarii]SHO48194.1 Protein of unknown function [Desulfopila aestuarii DSM 18488]